MDGVTKAEGTLVMVAAAILAFVAWRTASKVGDMVTSAGDLGRRIATATGDIVDDVGNGAAQTLRDGPPVLGVSASQLKNWWQNYGRRLYVDQTASMTPSDDAPYVDPMGNVVLPAPAQDYASLTNKEGD